MTEVLYAGREASERAAASLRAGQLVAFGTETVYGLGADATNAAAVSRVFSVKGRPSSNPLIVHYAFAAAIGVDVVVDSRAEALAAAFWPGPLTLVLPKRSGSMIARAASAGLSSLAVRVPVLPDPNLLSLASVPVVAPSANRSGRVSPTSAGDVMEELGGKIEMVIDSGRCAIGVESTVVSLLEEIPRLLRHGGVSSEALRRVVGQLIEGPQERAPALAPGQLASHYAPSCTVLLGQSEPREGYAYLGFAHRSVPAPRGFNLSVNGDLREAASHLFQGLRRLDKVVHDRGMLGICVAPIPGRGIGSAINDRLSRAAAARA